MAADVRVYATTELAAGAAARRVVRAAGQAVDARGAFVLALSGGETPRLLYRQLADERWASSIEWGRVQVIWGDERCVPPDHAASNYRMARETLLDRVPLPPTHVHRIRGEEIPAVAATGYEQTLRALLRTPEGPPPQVSGRRIDLVLLGLGTDGHTASLFPGDVGAHTSRRWVVPSLHDPGATWRVTLTPCLINAAAEVLFLVSGRDKEDIVHRTLQGPAVPHELPAQLIAPISGRVHWVLDDAAAGALTH